MNNVITRSLFGEIIECLEDGKIALLFGTRRVGKTTLLNEVINYYNARGVKSLLINCDTIRGQKSLNTTDDQELANLIKDVDILAVDEAQNVESIGKTLKIIHDVFPKVKAIATGS